MYTKEHVASKRLIESIIGIDILLGVNYNHILNDKGLVSRCISKINV